MHDQDGSYDEQVSTVKKHDSRTKSDRSLSCIVLVRLNCHESSTIDMIWLYVEAEADIGAQASGR